MISHLARRIHLIRRGNGIEWRAVGIVMSLNLLLAAAGSSEAQTTYVWQSASGGSWATPSNWNPAGPAVGISTAVNTANFDNLTLSANTTVTLDGNQSIGNLTFGDLGSTYNWIINPGSPLTSTLTLTSSATPTINVVNQAATFNVVLAGTQGFTLTGSGTLVLGAANTYTGATTVSSGTLQIANSLAAQSSTVTLSGGAVTFGSSITSATFGNLSGTGNLALVNTAATPAGVALTVGGLNASATFSGNLTDGGLGGSLIKLGTGTLTLSGGANTYTGGTILSAGSIAIANGTALGTGTYTVNLTGAGTMLTVANTAATTVANNIVLPSPSANAKVILVKNAASSTTGTTVNLTGVISGGNSNTTWELNSNTGGDATTNYEFSGTNTFVATVNLNRGYILVNNPAGLGNTNAIQLDGNLNPAGDLQFASSMTLPNPIQLQENEIIGASGFTVTLSGTISGAHTLTNGGPGTMILTNTANSFSSATFTNGTLSVAANSQLGAAAGALTFSGGALQITGNTPFSATRAVTLTSGFNGTFDILNPAGATFSGVVSGAGSLTKIDGGTLILTNINNSYSGGTFINGGELSVSAEGMLGNAGGALNFGGGVLQVTGTTYTSTFRTINWLAGGGGFDIASAANTFTVSQNLNDPGSPASFTKLGAGTLVLASTNTYTGGTTVLGGTLQAGTGGGVFGPGVVAVTPSAGTAILDVAGSIPTVSGLTLGGAAGTTAQVIASGGGALQLAQAGSGVTFNGTANTGVISAAIDLNGGAQTFTVDVTTASPVGLTISGVIGDTVGGASLIKAGPGTLAFAASNTYTGPTTVSAGTLQLQSGTTQVSPITVSNGAGLAVANPTATGTAAISSVTFGSAAIDATSLSFTLSSAWTTTTPLLTVAGALTANGTTTINLASQASLSLGTYQLVGYGSLTGAVPGSPGFVLGTLPNPRIVAHLVNNSVNHFIDLDITNVDNPKWTGAVNGVWDATTLNWKLVNAGTATAYMPGDVVLFDDTATGTTSITLNSTVAPNSVTFNNNSKTYSIGGTGAITGSTSLTLNGTGTVILTNTNTYTGTTTINAGALQIGNGTTSGSLPATTVTVGSSGALAFNPGSAGASYSGIIAGSGALNILGTNTTVLTGANTFTGVTTIAASATLQMGNGTNSGALAGNVTNNGTLVFNPGAFGQTLSGVISGTGAVSQIGANTTILTSANTYSGGTTITAGTLQIGDGVTLGTLLPGNVANGASLVFNAASDNPTYAGIISGSGAVIATGSNTITLSGLNTYTGPTTVTGGVLSVSSLAIGGAASGIGKSSNASANLVLNGGVLQYTGPAVVIDRSLTVGTSGGGITVAPGSSLTTSGTVAGGTAAGMFTVNSLTPTGATGGALTFTATNALAAGSVTVSSGTLTIAAQTLSKSLVITVGAGAFLQTTGALSTTTDPNLATNEVLTGGGTLTLAMTNSSATNPDINFNINDAANSNANWGTQINVAINLGSSQRYVWGATNHNAVGVYGTQADCVFLQPISGTGGMTFVAQDNYGTSMEVPFYLLAANTFTGMVEIQRGSVYLGNASALAQGNKLLMDPASGNNARFFLYGNNAIVSNPSTGGSVGTSVIANSPGATTANAILTVMQTSNTTFAGTLVDVQAEYSNGGTPGNLGLALATGSTGILTLTGTNTYSGGTTLNGGELSVSSESNLGATTGALSFGGGILQVTGTTYTSTARTINWLAGGGGFDINSAANTFTVSGSLTDPGSPAPLTKLGAGTLVLSGTNTYTGGTTVLGGTLVAGAGGKVFGTGVINLNPSAGTVTLDVGAFTPTVGGLTLGGAAGTTVQVVASGGGTLQLASTGTSVTFVGAGNAAVISPAIDLNGGTQTFTVGTTTTSPIGLTINGAVGDSAGGGTLIKAGPGTLALTASNTYTGATSVSAGTLQIKGGTAQASAITVSNGAAFSVVYAGATTTTTISSNLTFGNVSTDSTTLNLSLTSSWNTTTPLLQMTGALTANGATTINLSSLTSLSLGSYELIGYGSLSGAVPGTPGFVLGSLPNSRFIANLSNNSTSHFIDLNITGVDSPKWTGAVNGIWDTTTNNWKLVNAGTVTAYIQGDTVLFDDTATGTTSVTLNIAATPSSVTFNNNSKTYTIAGTGKISGAAGVLQTGTGTTFLTTVNDYTGGTFFNAGVISIASDSNLGTGGLFFNGGALQITGSTAFASTKPITFNGNGTFDVQDTAGATISGPFAGNGNMTKISSGALILNGSGGAYGGNVTISAGTLQFGDGFNSVSSLTGNISIASSSALILMPGASGLSASGTISGSGSLQVLAGAVTLNGASNTYSGGTTVSGGASLSIGAAGSLGSNAVTLGGGTLNLGGSASYSIANNIVLNAAGGTIGASNTAGITLAGIISGAGPLTINVGSTLTLGSLNTYTGATTINGGTLVISTLAVGGMPSSIGASTNSAANLVINGTTLQYTGPTVSIDRGLTVGTNGATITVPAGATLTTSGGVAGGTSAGLLTTSGNLTVSTLAAGNVAVSSGTLTIGATNLSLSGTITIATGAILQTTATLSTTSDPNVASNSVVTGGGTLILAMTNSSATNPDINFNSNDIAGTNANWGTQINVPVNLGSSQRYFWGATNHNAVGVYGTQADCVFLQPISGTGGMTFVAQDNYGTSMEVPFYLTAANSFTGMVEIQRGSVYLGNAAALVQGNKLLMDPASGNNARFFLYGYNATVSNISTLGSAGTVVIANSPGNGTMPSTLTVIQTSNTTFAGTLVDVQAEYSNGGTPGNLSLTLDPTSTGTLTLTGANTYSGVTTINGGVLSATTLAIGGSASGIGASTNAASNLILNGGTLQYSGSTAAITDRLFTIGSGGALDASGTTAAATVTWNNTGAVAFSGTGAATLTLTGSNTGTNTLAPTIADGAGPTSVVKSGIGQWLLSGANTYSGGTTVSGGILGAGASGTVFGVGTVAVTPATGTATLDVGAFIPTVTGLTLGGSPGTTAQVIASGGGTLQLAQSGTGITFNGAGNGAVISAAVDLNGGAQTVTVGTITSSPVGLTISGIIGDSSSGSASLIKAGPGTLALAANNTYTGPTTVSAGTLQIQAGTTQASPITVSNGAALAIANPAATATATVSSLTFGSTSTDSSTLNFSLFGAWNSTTPLLAVTGALTANGKATINLSSTTTLALGTYELINYGTLSGAVPGSPGFVLGTLPNPRFNATLSNLAGSHLIDLNIISSDNPKWTGAVNGNWDTTTQNWKLVNAGTVTAYIQNDTVLFDDTATGTTNVTLNIAAAPSSVIFNNNTLTYTIAGTGKITGFTGLTLNGAGTVVLTTVNDYTGATTVNAGTLQIGDGTNTGVLPATLVTLGTGGTLAFKPGSGGITYAGVITGGGSVSALGANTTVLTGANNYAGVTTIATGATLQIGNGTNSGAVAGNVTDGGALIFNPGAAALTVAGVVSGGGTVSQIGANTTILAGANTYSGGTTITGGTLQIGNGTTSGALPGNVTDSGILLLNPGSTGLTVGGVISGNGAVIATGSNTTTLSGLNTYTGATSVTGGVLSVSSIAIGGMASGIGESSKAATNLVINGGATLQYTGPSTQTDRSFTIGAGGGTLAITSSTTNLTFGGSIAGAGTFTMAGPGTAIFTAANALGANARAVNVTGGTLSFATQTFGRNTQLTVFAGAVAQSTGTLNLSVLLNGASGSTDVLGAGTLQLLSTTGSAATPDLYFGPDHSGNAYYGTTLAVSTLDLGSSQRYIDAKTGHNSISNYYPYEDAAITSNIIGSGGITYTAQNSYSGLYTQMLLGGANTFTGKLEIDLGSVYLNNPSALVQSNQLVLTNAGTGYSRLFLFGQNATVSNLQSAGTAANISIANANVNNNSGPFPGGTVPNSVLTVVQTTNTTFAGTLVDSIAEYDSGSGLASGTLGLTISAGSTGTLTLTGVNTYSGGTTIAGGMLNINSDSALGAAAGVVNLTGGTLQFAAGGNVTLNSSRSIVLGGGAFDTSSGNDTINGVISGTNLIKNGAGDLALTNINTYAGSTIVNAGGLVVGSSATLGSGPLLVNNANPAPSSTDVYLYNTAGQTVGNLSSNLSGAASGNTAGIFLSTGVTLTVNQTAPTTFQGTIFGGGSLILGSSSTSTLTLTGNSTYGGSTTINGGTIQLGATGGPAVANVLPTTTSLTLATGSTLKLNNNNQTIAALNTSAGNINTGTGTGAF